MAHYVDTERERLLCLHLSRLEAADLAEKIIRILALRSGEAPEVLVVEQGALKHRILFEVDPR